MDRLLWPPHFTRAANRDASLKPGKLSVLRTIRPLAFTTHLLIILKNDEAMLVETQISKLDGSDCDTKVSKQK